MNLSKLIQELQTLSESEQSGSLEQKEIQKAEFAKIVTCLRTIEGSEEWRSLKRLLFDGIVASLERQLRLEARKEAPDTQKLARLSGQLLWAEKYADLGKLANLFEVQLKGIKQQLYGKESPGRTSEGSNSL